jgi:hypothetical protein
VTSSRPPRRDLTLACLGLLHAAATASSAPAGEVARQLELLRHSGLRSSGEEGGGLAGIPGWLTDMSSGLAMILSAATQPDSSDEPVTSVPAEVTRLLGDDLVADLLSLADDLPLAGGGSGPTALAAPVVVLAAAGGCVATSLWLTSDPISGHPWFSTTESLTDPPANTAAAIRRALSPFESLAECTIETAPGEGYIWPTEVPGRPVLGLRSALAALAGIAGLSELPQSLVAIGDGDSGGGFKPLDETEISAHTAALAHLSCAILVPTVSGWQLTRPDRTVLAVGDADHGLDGAAQLVWGEEWAAWKHRQHRTELITLGWLPVDWEAVPRAQQVPETDVNQVDSLFAIFYKERAVAVLGGPTASGKSVMVRRLAARLARRLKHPPLTRVIASTLHELPDRQTALRVGQHALGMDEAAHGQRRFLVLEDLYSVGGGDVDDLLPYLSSSLSASVLAVLEYDPNSNDEWHTDHLSVVPAVVGPRAMREFVERLCREHPDTLDQSAGLAELDSPHPTRDVKRLIQIMAASLMAAREKQPGLAYDAALAEQFRSLDDAARVTLAETAAWSLARGAVEHELLSAVDPGDAAAFGVQATIDSSLYHIPSPDDCRAILAAYGSSEAGRPEASDRSAQPLNGTLADLLLPRLLISLRNGSREALTWLQGVRLYRNSLCAEVIRRTWDEGALREWVQQASPADIARLLVSLSFVLSDQVVRYALNSLVTRLCEQTPWVNIQETLVILRCLRTYLSEITPQWPDVSAWIHDQVSAILTGESGNPAERFQLLWRVDSFHDLALKEMIAERSVDVLRGLDSSRADDYYLVRRVRSMQYRAELALQWEQQRFPIDQEEPVQALLHSEPPDGAGFHVVLAWLTLLRFFSQDDWEGILDAHDDRLTSAMRYTSPREFSRAVDELHHFGTTYATFLFSRAIRAGTRRRRAREPSPFIEAVRKLLHDAPPMEAVEMLRSISSVHPRAAYDLINSAFDVPDDELAAKMARDVGSMADTKAAGMLLSVTHAVDDLYLLRSAGFAHRFGEHLGEERALRMMRDDPRPSVKYYLIKGLWDAQVSFRHECLATARDVIVDNIASSRKAWGPRLALQLGADVELGQRFLVELREHLPLRTILRGMGYYSPPEAQVEFHRLGRALYPEAADQYAREFNVDTFLEPLVAVAPVTAVECCREVGRTLADAGYHNGSQSIVEAADRVMGETDVWANRLARTRTGDELAQALNIFIGIDRQKTRSVVATLARRSPREEKSESLLVWKTRQAMFDYPPAGANLLSSLEDTEAGLGRAIYDHLRTDPVLQQVFGYELQLLQSISAQSAAARHLAAIAVLPDQPGTDWMSVTSRFKLQFVPKLANPQALTDIIRMLGIWRQSWADTAVSSVDHSKLSARLRLGLSRDLSPAVALAGLHYDFHQPAGSALILDTLSEFSPSRIIDCIGLRQTRQLLDLVRMLHPAQVGALAAAINASIGSHLRQPVVLDERNQWIEIGYACHSLKKAGFPVTETEAPYTSPNLNHPAEVIWGLRHLPDSVWRQRSLAAATNRLLANTTAEHGSLFCMLAAASTVGRVGEVSALAAEGARGACLSFRQLRILHELADRDAELAKLLAGFADRIQQRLTYPTAAIDWDAQRLAEFLSIRKGASQGPANAASETGGR